MTQSELLEFLDTLVLFHSKAEKEKVSQILCYSSENYLMSIPTRDELVVRNNKGSTLIFEDEIANHRDIPFMLVDIEESKEYIYETSHYILHLYGYLINGQKAVVAITGIKVFFDIRILKNASISKF